MPDSTSLPAVEELARTPAVALFVERAHAARPSFALTADNEPQLEAVRKVLVEKMVKRGVDPKALDPQKLEEATHKTVRQKVKLKSGIDKDTAKTIQRAIKDLKLKVNASIQGDALRVSSPKKDQLQEVIAHLKANPPGIPLQFNNYR